LKSNSWKTFEGPSKRLLDETDRSLKAELVMEDDGGGEKINQVNLYI